MRLALLVLLMGLLALAPAGCLGSSGSSVTYSTTDLEGTWDFETTHDSDGSHETGWFQFAFTGLTVELVDDWWNEQARSLLDDPDVFDIYVTLSSTGRFEMGFSCDYGLEYGVGTWTGNMNAAKDLMTGTYLYDEWEDLEGNGNWVNTLHTGTIAIWLP